MTSQRGEQILSEVKGLWGYAQSPTLQTSVADLTKVNEGIKYISGRAKTESIYLEDSLRSALVKESSSSLYAGYNRMGRQIFCQQFPAKFNRAFFSARNKDAEAALMHNPFPAQYAVVIINALKVAAEEASAYCQVSFEGQAMSAAKQLNEFSSSSEKASEVIWVGELCQKLKRVSGSEEDRACLSKSLDLNFTAWLSQKVLGDEK